MILPCFGDHRWQYRTAAVEHRGKICLDDTAPPAVCQIREQTDVGNPGIVDKNVDLPTDGGYLLEHGSNLDGSLTSQRKQSQEPPGSAQIFSDGF